MTAIMKNTWILLQAALLIMLVSCNLDVAPADSLTGDQMADATTGLEDIINGCYTIFKDEQTDFTNSWYLRQYFQMSDFSCDDVTYGWGTEDNLHMIFVYDERDASLDNFTAFWTANYSLIYAANVGINLANQKEEDVDVLHLKAEAMFLKAFALHNLVRYYALPYSSSTADSPGVIIREDYIDTENKARATIGETYDYILELLLEAESIFEEAQDCSRSSEKGYVSLGACRALLCRVYLYLQEWDNCISYASIIIDSGEYTLASPTEYPTYFRNAPSQSETIWCVRMVTADDHDSGSIASMIMTSGDGCWGEEGYSPSLLSDMGYDDTELREADSRFSYVEEPNVNSSNITLYPCSKFSWQDDIKTLSSPVMFRLSEIYLNRAEAYAHKGNESSALADANTIREARIIPPDGKTIDDFFYTSDDVTSSSIIDVVLKERRIELCFEANRFFDLRRNGMDIVRNYWGYQLPSFTPGQNTSTLPGLSVEGVVTDADYSRLVFPIPNTEIINNPLCEQNEGY